MQIIDVMDGQIHVESVLQIGTTITVDFFEDENEIKTYYVNRTYCLYYIVRMAGIILFDALNTFW